MTHHPLQRSIIIGLILMLTAGTAWADERIAIVHLNDRDNPIRGTLVEEAPDRLILMIAGIRTPIMKDRIERVEYERTLADEYREDRAALADDDYDGRYALAKALYDRETLEAYRLALTELTSLTSDNADHRQARLLKQLVEQRIKAAEAIAEDAGNADRPTPARPTDAPATPPASQVKTLDRDQINLLKVFELDLDARPRIVIPRPAIDQFLERYRSNSAVADYTDRAGQARFRNLDGHEQLRIMFRAQAREMYSEVVVRDEPEALSTFRTRVNPRYVVGYFVRMFGQHPADGLHLITLAPNSEASAYTNFLALHRATKDGAKFIDRDRPADSLLIQWGLPRADAQFPAPNVPNWRPYFRGKDDPRYREHIAWIDSLYRPAPDYPIEFTFPKPPADGEADAAN